MPLPTAVERFWPKVNKTEGCWLWTAQVNNKGYGCFSVRGYLCYAHRFAWAITNGPIPSGTNVLHRCDNPPCVNPEHLFLGSQADNMRDAAMKGRARGPRGERSCTAKLTEADVRAIRADPRRHHIIAASYGVKRLAIWKIKHRKSWQHVD